MMVSLGGQIGQFIAHKHAEQALRDAEANYRSIFENAMEGIFQTTPEGRYLSANPALARMLGYASPEELLAEVTDLGRQMCVRPESRLELKRRLETDGQVREFENEIYRKDGSKRWTNINARVVRDASGAVRYYEGTSQDITERKRAEQALRESEAGKTAIMESALDGILTIDWAGKIVEFNSAAEKMFGCSRANAIGRELAAVLIPASLREWFGRGLAGHFATDEGPVLGGRIEIKALRADATEFPAELTVTRINREGPPMWTVFIRDNSSRKRAEAQIATLAHAVESTAEPICITDLEDRFTFVNRAFQKTYGYTEAEILGKTPELLFSPNNPQSLMTEILTQTRSGGWRGEVLDLRKDGSEFPVSLTTSQIKDQNGRILGLMGVAEDITERKRAEEQIRLLADAVQSTRELISITDSKNSFTFVNQAYLET
jgi:PAS domain S-box-containing protein